MSHISYQTTWLADHNLITAHEKVQNSDHSGIWVPSAQCIATCTRLSIVSMIYMVLYVCHGRFRLRVEDWLNCLYSQVSDNQPDLFPMSEITAKHCKSLNCIFECCRFS